ncbi:TPA: site-specific integrase [Candidatus Poribacteria bacterium]|nr:site-specific integrase [Candidatus Poribacteria bacterium]
MNLVIRNYIMQSGERFSLIFDKDDWGCGFPLFYPTYYTTCRLRIGKTHNTQKDVLRTIKKLYTWAHKENIDLHTIFMTKRFLRPYEIDSLSQYLRTNEKDGSIISGLKHNNNLTSVADYLCWYASEIITDSNAPEVSGMIDKMNKGIRIRRVRKAGSEARKRQRLLAKKLPEKAESTLLALFHNPLMRLTQTSQMTPRYRNIVALRILYVTGMRLGELLGLRIQDFVIASGGEPAYLIVRRYHDDKVDDRTIQPVAKMLERQVPIDQGLEKAICEYLKFRAEVPNVGFDDNDFLLVNHLRGRRQGRAITESNFRSAFTVLQKKFPTLIGVYPHLLRHDCNYRFSKMATAIGMTGEEEQKLREYLMGWVEGSPSSNIYLQRYTQEKALAIGLKTANDTAKKIDNSGETIG